MNPNPAGKGSPFAPSWQAEVGQWQDMLAEGPWGDKAKHCQVHIVGGGAPAPDGAVPVLALLLQLQHPLPQPADDLPAETPVRSATRAASLLWRLAVWPQLGRVPCS